MANSKSIWTERSLEWSVRVSLPFLSIGGRLQGPWLLEVSDLKGGRIPVNLSEADLSIFLGKIKQFNEDYLKLTGIGSDGLELHRWINGRKHARLRIQKYIGIDQFFPQFINLI